MAREAESADVDTPAFMTEEACGTATCLKISLLRNEQPIVQVSFPAYAIANLADLVPYEMRGRVAAEALDLELLAASVAARGCPRGEIFSLAGTHDVVRAWME
jgi:hypothetical protein